MNQYTILSSLKKLQIGSVCFNKISRSYGIVIASCNESGTWYDVKTSSTVISWPVDMLSPVEIYVLSDTEPVDGDWVIPVKESKPWPYKKAPCPLPYWGNPYSCKLIVSTTDDLIKSNGEAIKRLSREEIFEYIENTKPNYIT